MFIHFNQTQYFFRPENNHFKIPWPYEPCCKSNFLPFNLTLNYLLSTKNSPTYGPGVFEVARHLPSAHFAHVRPEHDTLLKVTLGVHFHLSRLLLAGRSGQEQARGQRQRRPGGGPAAAAATAASPPRLPGRQHGIRDVVCVGGRLKERGILEELVVV